jgi:hypothetical protein
MAEGEGSVTRDYRGTKGMIDDADPVAPPPDERTRRRNVGGSKVVSPRPGVRDPGPAHEGSEGEPAYGAPMDTPKPSGEKTTKEKAATPDPAKAQPEKKDDDDKE